MTYASPELVDFLVTPLSADPGLPQRLAEHMLSGSSIYLKLVAVGGLARILQAVTRNETAAVRFSWFAWTAAVLLGASVVTDIPPVFAVATAVVGVAMCAGAYLAGLALNTFSAIFPLEPTPEDVRRARARRRFRNRYAPLFDVLAPMTTHGGRRSLRTFSAGLLSLGLLLALPGSALSPPLLLGGGTLLLLSTFYAKPLFWGWTRWAYRRKGPSRFA